MAIKLTFPVDATKITAPSLHQWDYGQILEIESADLAPYVEVHFACSGMTEAIARPCTVISGTATVAIPDVCLEHAGTIMAWVFEINGTEGMTRKTITIPVIGRVKPVPGGDVPAESYDKYIELIAEFREAAAEVLAGNVTVVRAKNANYAAEAGHANVASSANTATSADAVTSYDAKDVAGHLDNLTTPGRYYCDWSVGTPTGSYGYVDVFRRNSNTMQVFYSWTSGDVYLRKTSNPEATNKQWSSWQQGGANSLYIESARMNSPSQAGLYLIERIENGVVYSEILFITDLNRDVVSSVEGGACYNALAKKIETNNGTLSNVILIGSYADNSVG